MKIKFYDSNFKHENIKYVIIPALYDNQWIFVKHKKRTTWELPAGHIEAGETSMEAAKRELYEETGATDYSLFSVSIYSVESDGENLEFGHLFFADIKELSSLPPTEIAKISLRSFLPQNLTYPEIQPLLFNKVLEVLKNRQQL